MIHSIFVTRAQKKIYFGLTGWSHGSQVQSCIVQPSTPAKNIQMWRSEWWTGESKSSEQHLHSITYLQWMSITRILPWKSNHQLGSPQTSIKFHEASVCFKHRPIGQHQQCGEAAISNLAFVTTEFIPNRCKHFHHYGMVTHTWMQVNEWMLAVQDVRHTELSLHVCNHTLLLLVKAVTLQVNVPRCWTPRKAKKSICFATGCKCLIFPLSPAQN